MIRTAELRHFILKRFHFGPQNVLLRGAHALDCGQHFLSHLGVLPL
jgi:hypothetical protein